ncbi:hypothetical protein DL764_005355 [Monosporascus ibericus]|uniref:F-box domain-containing protein n=1 Tax=Monosporascus ibericus TaxID=155417 RepID=A0A4Q4T9L7_9PEZI|nr:hypothetical protein DL764_005355 [Monosporascus ibericus]
MATAPSPSSSPPPPPFAPDADDKPANMSADAKDGKPSTTVTAAAKAPSAFDKLPDEIIQQILQLADPNSFASLVLLNPKWRRVSQQAQLYAHHLSQCYSYAASHGALPAAVDDTSLLILRQLFAREVKRNLFEAYSRPRTTTIKLISNSISSSSAPGGEGLQFNASPKGHHLLAYNSSRIYILDVRGPELAVKRELKILRRPASTCILDDGSLLAVLSSDMQIDLYDLRQSPPRRKRSLILDNAPRAIALSPCGSVLAAAYESGIEVSSIAPEALPSDRRAVKCDGVDSLAFSFDGTQLLGTTTTSQPPNTVILTAPYYDPGNQAAADNISPMWTTSILFPNSSRDCSHAVLLQESSLVEAAWTFTYDKSFETFRAVRIDDLRNGTTYFTGPVPTGNSPGPLLPSTLPAANCTGDLVSAGFEGRDVWVYGIPEDLEAVPDVSTTVSDAPPPHGLHRRNSGLSVRSPSRTLDGDNARVPQWQLLCDKLRNTFVSGRKIARLDNVNTVKWVSDFGDYTLQERLVVAARGVLPSKPITEEDGIDFVDGGRITILDFDYGVEDGGHDDITIEVGTREPEILEEESRDLDAEVAIVRRRTVAQNRRSGVMRSATTAAHQVDHLLVPPPPLPSLPGSEDPLVPRAMPTARNTSKPQQEDTEVSLEEAQEALDAPYTHASPRSGPTLRRAATAAAVNRRRNPEPPVAGPVQYRRADGRREHPHESDADNWVPPPPPYTKEADPSDLPAFLRHAAIPGVGLEQPSRQPLTQLARPARPTEVTPHAATSNRPELPRIQTSSARGRQIPTSWNPHSPHQRMTSDSASVTRPATGRTGTERPMTSPSTHHNNIARPEDEEDVYDASPAGSPRRAARSQYPVQTQEWSSQRQAPTATTSSTADFISASSSSCGTADGSFRLSIQANRSNISLPPRPVGDSRRSEEQGGASPTIRRISNAGTWPRAPEVPKPVSASAMDGFPRSAPVVAAPNDDLISASLPPAPRLDQLASLSNRQDSSTPRRASGVFQVPRVPVGRRNSQDRASLRHSVAVPGLGTVPSSPSPDQPLIISTPKGVSGAFDGPGQSSSHINPTAPVLLAPVPRHPRASATSAILQPTADRLDTAYSNDGAGGRGPGREGGISYAASAPPQPLTASSLRHHTSLSRRQSRARRSAAKNISDAKTRGWTGRKKNRKRKDIETASATGWTDVSCAGGAPAAWQKKEKKCAVM